LQLISKPTNEESVEALRWFVKNYLCSTGGKTMANQQKDQRNITSTGPTAASAPPKPSNVGIPEQKATGAESGEKLKSSAAGLYEHAKETASDSYEVVATKAKSSLEQRKNESSSGLITVADSVRQMGGQLRNTAEPNRLTDITSQYTGKAAGALEQVANYFERKDLRAIMRDTEDFARRNPAIFFGGAFALGLLAARFLKSSPDRMTPSGMPMEQSPRSVSPPAPGSQPAGSIPRTA
jgi:hypothetical protein